ncbi:MAG: polysulfide reductase NrfD [Acidobacteriota bacterium]|nr:polysulfide reductase NrfD [Acidobacteriota bacterium]
MSNKHQSWGWMLAVDFFFAGAGGGMLVLAALVELFGNSRMSLAGNLLGPAFMCIGCIFLIFELGKPFRAWRVFMNPKAILTVGAWTMSVAIATAFVYAAMALPAKAFPLNLLPFDPIVWRDWVWAGKLLAVVNLITGLVVATYPGVLLGRLKGRPFWTGPGIMALFLLSSLVTGTAAHYLCGFVTEAPSVVVWNALPGVFALLLMFQLVLWIGYLWIKQSGATENEAAAARRWTSGDRSLAGKGAFLFLGTLVPLVLALLPNPAAQAVAAALVLFGGVTMRLLVIKSGDDRTYLPGEKRYNLRLPNGDEAFLHKSAH